MPTPTCEGKITLCNPPGALGAAEVHCQRVSSLQHRLNFNPAWSKEVYKCLVVGREMLLRSGEK